MKRCIKLKAPNGDVRLIEEGKPYRKLPGEVVLDVDPTCGGEVKQFVPGEKRQSLQNELDRAIGGGLGDWIKVMATPAAKLVGKDKCSICEARRIVTNAYAQIKAKHGMLRALEIIKDLWAYSFKASPDEVLEELKKHL